MATIDYLQRHKWTAQPNDMIGGWCITLDIRLTPAEGAIVVGDFLDEPLAKHMVTLHNEWLEREYAGG